VERDFSVAANPNGVWSYGWKSTLAGEFTLLAQAGSYSDGEVPFEEWQLASGEIPIVLRNASTNLTWNGGEGDMPPGAVWIYPGFNGWTQNFCVVRFTVPGQGNGRYLLESAAESRLSGISSKDSDYHVVVNGVEVFGIFLPPNARTGYTNEFLLNHGDTVDFMTGRGADGDAYGSGLRLRATLITPAPCSTSYKARATAQLVNGFVVDATITDPGCGYTNAPLVLIQGGGGSGATARAVITDGRVTRIIITDAGLGYDTLPRIVIASPPFVPTLNISVSRVKVAQNVVLGRRYVLESSSDLANWGATGTPFTAESETIENEFEVNVTGGFFRIREVP
jgi:hypothetical protein